MRRKSRIVHGYTPRTGTVSVEQFAPTCVFPIGGLADVDMKGQHHVSRIRSGLTVGPPLEQLSDFPIPDMLTLWLQGKVGCLLDQSPDVSSAWTIASRYYPVKQGNEIVKPDREYAAMAPVQVYVL